jgi:hypothetical protein
MPGPAARARKDPAPEGRALRDAGSAGRAVPGQAMRLARPPVVSAQMMKTFRAIRMTDQTG